MNFYFEKSSYRIPPKEPCEYSNHLLCLNRGEKVYFFRDYSGQEFAFSVIENLFPSAPKTENSTVWDQIASWKEMQAKEEAKKQHKPIIERCDDGITIETIYLSENKRDTKIYDKNNKIIRRGDITAWCPEENLLKYRENRMEYIYDTRKNQVVFEIYASAIGRKYHTVLEIFDNKLLVRKYGSAADWGFQLFSADNGKVFLKLKSSTTGITLLKTATGTIRELWWQGRLYYMNENYKAFWSREIEKDKKDYRSWQTRDLVN